jgi:hypothetical protein
MIRSGIDDRDASPRNATEEVIRRALESAGAIFVDENGEGPGVRLRKGA